MRRLFWRAGFGATPREARYWARKGKARTIRWLLNGGPSPAPRMKPPRVDGHRLDPENEWGHNVLWWLDRMVRSRRPLEEKLTLFWHDHFATGDQDTPLMLAQNRTLRRHALGRFPNLLRAVTSDPAMLLFLSLADSDKEAPNENYARELMELFTLGRGYTERDIRQASRALTGFRVDWRENGPPRCYYEREAHDAGVKRILGHKGHFDWQDVLRLCLNHPAHAPFLVEKLWDYFVGTPISGATRRRLAQTYLRSGHRIKPVVAAILAHPALYRKLDAPGMVKSPVVYLAGALRSTGQGIDRDSWGWLLESMGQYPFHPPSVAGWDWGTAWLSSNAMRVRFDVANYLLDTPRLRVKDGSTPARLSPRAAVGRASRALGNPWTSSRTDAELLRVARRLLTERKLKNGEWRQDKQERADMCQRVLRQLLLSGPDAHVH
ncbi:MAG TPA: DUF1800 domain-containing protein [Thermoleophilaceae bacterium]|nr:DUF1800 domain-containing protein [Thermoleophilaceae bacterium]